MGFHHVMLEVFNSLITVHANTMGRLRARSISGVDITHPPRRHEGQTFIMRLPARWTEMLGIGMMWRWHRGVGVPRDQPGNPHIRHQKCATNQ